MSTNGGPPPDAGAAAFALQQDIAQRMQSSGKGTRILALLPDADTGSGLSPRAAGLDKPICQLAQSFKNRRANGSAMEAAINAVHEFMKKANSEAAIIYSGDMPSGTPVTSNIPPGAGAPITLE